MTPEYVENPEIYQMAQFIYKRPDNTKVGEYYNRPIDMLDYDIGLSTMKYTNLNYKNWYAHKSKSMYSDNIDKFAENEARVLMHPQYIYRRNRLLTTLNYDERAEQSIFNRQHYNMTQTSGTSFSKELRNDKTFIKPTKPIFTVDDQAKNKNVTKIGNDSKPMNIAMNMTEVENDYDLDSIDNNATELAANNASAYKPFLLTSFFGFIPRFDYNLRRLRGEETEFNPYSTEYKFVSNHDHL